MTDVDLLGIGSSGIGVAQQALSTVSNNIANLSTDGYSRQTTEIRQAQPKDVGNGYIGTGAYFDGVARQYDSFLESSLQQATSDLNHRVLLSSMPTVCLICSATKKLDLRRH